MRRSKKMYSTCAFGSLALLFVTAAGCSAEVGSSRDSTIASETAQGTTAALTDENGEPVDTEPGSSSSSCRLLPRRCCDDFNGRCVKWISGCQSCP
jgi:hypothetical protein